MRKRNAEAPSAKEQIDALSDRELLRLVQERLASANKRPPAGKAKVVTDWTKVVHTCPAPHHSGKRTGTVAEMFGTRWVRGVERKQSWCFTCRATMNYYDKTRVRGPLAAK